MAVIQTQTVVVYWDEVPSPLLHYPETDREYRETLLPLSMSAGMNDSNGPMPDISNSFARGSCFVIATEKGVCWTGTPGTPLEEGLARVRKWFTFDKSVQEAKVEPLWQAVQELQQYFAGEKVSFSCPLDLRGTPFQLHVWQALQDIPYGETRSYGEIAEAIGRPSASRAVGAANGANPVAIIVPCHRVIGGNGTLTGYAGGLFTKSRLLALEGIKHKQVKG